MDQVTVLVVSRISDESKKLIQSVSPKVKLLDTTHLWNAPPKVNRFGDPEDFSSPEFDALLAQAEIIYGFRPPKNVTSRAPNLKWVQSMLTGVDYWLDQSIVQSPIMVTNVKGLFAVPVAETALEMILMFVKLAPTFFKQKQERKWQRIVPDQLRYKTVGIVGLGTIGKELARMVKPLAARVIAVRRSARKVGKARNVDLLLPTARLHQLLAESDFVVLTLPCTPETNKMIGEKELNIMKPSAYLINVGRGETIDDEALIQALQEKRISGAGLDTFAAEPLREDSPYWKMPNVIISPHISGAIENQDAATTGVFCKNLERYIEGKKLNNLVNKRSGY